MPRQKRGYPHLSGRMKDKVYYYRKNNKNKKHYFIRRAPATVTQTPATQRAATDFGDASKSSKLLRHALHGYTRFCNEKRLHCRLNKKMGEILRADVNHPSGKRVFTAENLQSLRLFRFNKAADIYDLLNSRPVIEKNESGGTSISFEGTFSNRIHALRNTTHITIKAIALYVDFARGTTRQVESDIVVVRRGEKFAPVIININHRNLTLILLEVQSFYEVNGQLHASQSKQGHALDIISVLAPIVEPKRKYRNKAPHFWLPYAPPAKPALIIKRVNDTSLPEG